jgi:hypothetical protein
MAAKQGQEFLLGMQDMTDCLWFHWSRGSVICSFLVDVEQ